MCSVDFIIIIILIKADVFLFLVHRLTIISTYQVLCVTEIVNPTYDILLKNTFIWNISIW